MRKLVNNNTLLEELNNSFIKDSSVAIHGLNFNSYDELPGLIASVFNKGLINKGKGGVVSNCEILGTTEYYDSERLISYAYYNRNGTVVNIYVDIPFVIEHDNKLYFIGPFLKHNEYQKYDKSINSIWVNQYVDENRLLPTEFIVGASVYNEKVNQTIYYENGNFMGRLNEEKKKEFINELLEASQSKRIIVIDENNIEGSYQEVLNMIELYREFKLDDYYVQSAKKYIEEKYLNQKQH